MRFIYFSSLFICTFTLLFGAAWCSHLVDKKSLIKESDEMNVPSIPFAQQFNAQRNDDQLKQPRVDVGGDKIKLKKKIKNTNKKTKKIHKNKSVSILTCNPTYNSETTDRLSSIASSTLPFTSVNPFSPSTLLTEQLLGPQESLLASLASSQSLLPSAPAVQVTQLRPYIDLISQSLGLRGVNPIDSIAPDTNDDDISKREPVTVVEETVATDGQTTAVTVEETTQDSSDLLAHELIAARLSPLKLDELLNLSELLISRILLSRTAIFSYF